MTITPISDDALAAIKAGLPEAADGPYEIDWYVCRADHDDAKADKKLKIGDELWRVPHSLGPVGIGHDHWSGWHLDVDQPTAEHIARLDPQTVASLIARLEADERMLGVLAKWVIQTSTLGSLAKLEESMIAAGFDLIKLGERSTE